MEEDMLKELLYSTESQTRVRQGEGASNFRNRA